MQNFIIQVGCPVRQCISQLHQSLFPVSSNSPIYWAATALSSSLPTPVPLNPLLNVTPHYPQIHDLKGSKPLRARVNGTNHSRSSIRTNQNNSLSPRRATDLPKSSYKPNIDSKNARLVNFALNATPSYVSLYDDVFTESCVAQGLEIFFSLESVGVLPTTSSYEVRHIEEFDGNAEFRDGNYFVTLPWHKETLWEVPSNFQLAKTIAYKVAKRNVSQNLEEWHLTQNWPDGHFQSQGRD